jgi:hypothetical protein
VLKRINPPIGVFLGLVLPLALTWHPAARAQPPGAPLHHTSAEACRTCHAKIYDQWRASMHAQSTALADPIHGAFYNLVVGDPRQEGVKHKASGKYPVCLKCHSPSAALDRSTKLDARPTYSEGVTCVSCHMLEKYQGIHGESGKMQLGISAYEVADRLQGPSGKTYTPQFAPPPPAGTESAAPSYHPFPMSGNPGLLRTSDACMGCHDQRNNPHGVPLCMTGAEFKNAGAFNCQQCHMPISDGFADHSMLGGHSAAMANRSVVLELDVKPLGDVLAAEVALQNMLPHDAPTGAPFRNLFLRVAAFDGQGNKVWQNYSEHPMKEDPQAMFMLKLVDDEGRPAPPPRAPAVGANTRLKPNETRRLHYEIPAEGVVLVRAELNYDLLLPPLKKKFGAQIPASLLQPTVIARNEVRLPTGN